MDVNDDGGELANLISVDVLDAEDRRCRDGSGDKVKRRPNSAPNNNNNNNNSSKSKSVKSLQSYMKKRQMLLLENDPNSSATIISQQQQQENATDINRSIEIFFGNLTNFKSFCSSIKQKPQVQSKDANKSTIPESFSDSEASSTTSNSEKSKCDSETELSIQAAKNRGSLKGSIYEIARPVVVSQIDEELENYQRLRKITGHVDLPIVTQGVRTYADDSDDYIESEEDNRGIGPEDTADEGRNAGKIEQQQQQQQETIEPEKNQGFVNDEITKCVENDDDENDDEDGRKEFELIPNPLNTAVDPDAVRKLCIVGHPLTTFVGLNNFKKLYEAWITNCSIKNLEWKYFKGMKELEYLYLFGGKITTIEPLRFENLKVLWLSNNKLTSLNFLTFGMRNLTDLNVANNQIATLEAEDLYKCVALRNFNVSANPLCTVQDLESINVIPSVKTFHLVDPSYGKCPIASICESRCVLICKLKHITSLNGRPVTSEERDAVEDYIRTRCFNYYANSATGSNFHLAVRKAVLQLAFKQLENLGNQIADLAVCAAKVLNADFTMSGISEFAHIKKKLSQQDSKVNTRLSNLKQMSRAYLRRIETVFCISRWEQEMDEWLKWIEFKSFGSIKGYILHSTADSEMRKDKKLKKDRDNIKEHLQKLIKATTCSTGFIKLETVIVIKDKGAEAGMEKLYEDNFSRGKQPKFIPPQVDHVNLQQQPEVQQADSHVFYGPPPAVQVYKIVSTYVDPKYKPSPPIFPFPESVPGLPERSQPIMLFLIANASSQEILGDPLQYFYNLLFEKSKFYKSVRLTNCISMAIELCGSENEFKSGGYHSVIFMVKILRECVISLGASQETSSMHADGCTIYGLTRPLCFTPAYIVYATRDIDEPVDLTEIGEDVIFPVEQILHEFHYRVAEMGGISKQQHPPYYLHRVQDGVKADLTAVTKIIPATGNLKMTAFLQSRQAGLQSIYKFLGPGIAENITSLDLSANGLALAVGLEGLNSLQKLNLSYNSLTTLSGLHRLPQLYELKTGWNCLRFFHSNLNTLLWACSNLAVLEILPNPFQDIRDYSHIPVLAHQSLPSLTRVDAWIAPFSPPMKIPISTSPCLENIKNLFCSELLKSSWIGDDALYMDYSGRCLNSLKVLSPFPQFKETQQQRSGILLNLSDNYLNSTTIFSSPLVQNPEWRSFLVKLELQENGLTDLEWFGSSLYPNLKILNLSNNLLNTIEAIEHACPYLLHLEISGNPFPPNINILNPLKSLKGLLILDASRTPLSALSEYVTFVYKQLQVQILDGIAMNNRKI